MTTENAVWQILTGRPFDVAAVRCANCRCALEGTRVAVVARSIEGGTWEIAATYCLADAPDTVPETPLGESVLATARMGSLVDVLHREDRPALLNVEITDCALDAPEATA